jgi:hypothetical protein
MFHGSIEPLVYQQLEELMVRYNFMEMPARGVKRKEPDPLYC